VVVEVKPGEEVVSVNVGWTVEKFVEEQKEPSRKAQGTSGKKTSSPKGNDVNGKKPAQAKAASNGRAGKSAVKNTASPRNTSSPAKTSSSKRKSAKGKK
jgi:hypothetical protein